MTRGIAAALLAGLLAVSAATAQAQDELQSPQPPAAGDQPAQKPPEVQTPPAGQNPPAAVGEAGHKETRNFFSALGHNLGDDVKHMPRLNTVYWLAGGGALALAVHQKDSTINAHFVNDTTDGLWTPGHIIGSTPVLLGSSFAVYIVGRTKKMGRVQHLGMDEIEATLLAEGITQGLKVAVRRDRPPQTDGNQSTTYSFPSGHATLTFAAATVLQQHLGYKAGIPTYLVASYVAMSRLHDNVHKASDVVFGAAMGVVIGRSVTWHGRNFYASPMLGRDRAGLQLALVN